MYHLPKTDMIDVVTVSWRSFCSPIKRHIHNILKHLVLYCYRIVIVPVANCCQQFALVQNKYAFILFVSNIYIYIKHKQQRRICDKIFEESEINHVYPMYIVDRTQIRFLKRSWKMIH